MKLHHPRNKAERKLAEEKHSIDEIKARAGRVRRKLLTEQAEIKETEDDLKEFRTG